jgi:acylphosphatase
MVPVDMVGKIKRMILVVSGIVQGVGYRFFTREKAALYGISGWVRNCANGDVEIDAQGDEKQLDLFLLALKKGPRMSHVSRVIITEADVVPGRQRFIITHEY